MLNIKLLMICRFYLTLYRHINGEKFRLIFYMGTPCIYTISNNMDSKLYFLSHACLTQTYKTLIYLYNIPVVMKRSLLIHTPHLTK